MPAMLEAGKLGSRAAKVGFDWPSADGLFDKLQEEIAELQAELPPVEGQPASSAAEEELGDLLFTAVNLARHLKLDPESALRFSNAKFRRRFAAMESEAGGTGCVGSPDAAATGRAMEPCERCRPGAVRTMSTAPQRDIRISPLTSFEHFDRCADVQQEIWGYGDGDVVSRRIFTVVSHIGGQVLGAFDGDTIVGFAFSLPGYRDGHAYLHSHILAVLPDYRNAGIGRRLKFAQRDDAIARGFDLMEWTFDPLEIKNAHLNIARLGAIVRRYEPDCYGPSTSPLQGGLPTDRLYAEWWLRSPRVVGLLRGEAPPTQVVEQRVTVPHAHLPVEAGPATAKSRTSGTKR